MPASTLEKSVAGKVAGKYLTFIVGSVAYGIPILKAREIIRLLDITPIPRLPAHIKGVINLRGKIVPVIDLRMRFGLPEATTTNRTCIIVTQVEIASATKLMGLIVDALEEVYSINAEDIEPAPHFGNGNTVSCIEHMAKVRGQVKALLNIDQMVQEDHEGLPLSFPALETTPAQS